MKTLTVAQMKYAEQLMVEQGSSYLALMEQAANACASTILTRFQLTVRPLVVLAGNGNNGGDGIAIATLLANEGVAVCLILCDGEPKTKEAQYQLANLSEEVLVLKLEDWDQVLAMVDRAPLVVDAIYGTGFHGTVKEALRPLITVVNLLHCPIISIDIPSGLSGDFGVVQPYFFKATHTLALAAPKKVHTNPNSIPHCGKIRLLDIGIDEDILDEVAYQPIVLDKELAGKLLPKRLPNTHKGDYGKLLVVAGSVGMSGAAMMATKAALRSGAGITTLASSEQVALIVAPTLMEAMCLLLAQTSAGSISYNALPTLKKQVETASALVLGCGMGRDPQTSQLILSLIREEIPLVLDADGINALAQDITIVKNRKAPCVLTPHPGEIARLLGISVEEAEQNRPRLARTVAEKLQVIVVLKGHETLIAFPDGTLYQNTTGNAGMAKGGSGDVLAGIIGGLLAQHHFSAKAAALLGVYLHGMAGDYCAVRFSQYSILAQDLIDALPLVFKQTESIYANPQEVLGNENGE